MADQIQFRTDDTIKWTDRFGGGADGAYAPSTGTDAPVDSACSGTSGTTSLTATNAGFSTGQLILIHQTQGTGAGNWQLNKIANYSAGTITTAYALTNTYGTGAQVLVMPSYSSGNIAGGVTLTGKAWNGTVGGIYAKFCNGTFSIVGNLVGSLTGFRGAQQTHLSGVGCAGEGSAQAPYQITAGANSNGGGGTPDYNAGAGAGGANGANGQNGANAGGTGGSAVGNASLTLAFFGGGGGMGWNDTQHAGVPDSGGGFILIIAKTITVTGSLPNTGGNGKNSAGTDCGSGGSAGGSTLLKGQAITLGSNLVTAIGGSGVGASRKGGDGSVGRIHADYSTTLTGTTSPTIDTTNDTIFTDISGGAFFQFM